MSLSFDWQWKDLITLRRVNLWKLPTQSVVMAESLKGFQSWLDFEGPIQGGAVV